MLDGRRARDSVELSVFDNGKGIAPEEQQKIWKRFYRVQTARSAGEGTGLGLPMVAQIVQLHGGTVELDSRAGWGTKFTVRLPVVEQEEIQKTEEVL